MSELIAVLRQEHQRQMSWLREKREATSKWINENSYDYSKSMPRNYIVPQAMRDKAMKWYRILFVAGIVLWFLF
jgi:hypothetical protein